MMLVINDELSREALETAADELFRSAVDFWPHRIDIKDKSIEDHRCVSVDVSVGQLRRMWKAMEGLGSK